MSQNKQYVYKFSVLLLLARNCERHTLLNKSIIIGMPFFIVFYLFIFKV